IKEAADVAALLQQAQSTLEKLQSECEFLSSETQSSGVFSPGSLRVAVCDLQMLMAAFSHVFETDLRAYCSRDPPSFSTETHVFQRIHQLLLAFTMVLIHLLNITVQESVSTQTDVRIRDVFSLLQS
ncbi:hypothetical protein JOQ06_007236, partial [Pogonophryne albipinna]